MAESARRELGPIGRELMRETVARHAASELRRPFRWVAPANYQPPTSGRRLDDTAIRSGDPGASMEKAKAFRRKLVDSTNHEREAALEHLRRRFVL